jgi:hypothetical protein
MFVVCGPAGCVSVCMSVSSEHILPICSYSSRFPELMEWMMNSGIALRSGEIWMLPWSKRGCIKSFRTESATKYKHTFHITR